MSAALKNVRRGDQDLAEVTSLADAVRTWATLEPEHRKSAVLTSERNLLVDGASRSSFEGESISALVELLPPPDGEG